MNYFSNLFGVRPMEVPCTTTITIVKCILHQFCEGLSAKREIHIDHRDGTECSYGDWIKPTQCCK